MVSILEFYEGKPLKLKNGEELTLNEILQKNNDWWDGCHDFIQWIFPTRTVSNYCLNAPILTKEVAETLNKKHGSQICLCCQRFVSFLLSQNMNKMNHNHLRITRMFESLSLISDSVGHLPELKLLLNFSENFLPYENVNIIDPVNGNSVEPVLNLDTFKYWSKAFFEKW